MEQLITLIILIFALNSCTYRSFTDAIESIYTDEVVLKPSNSNYNTPPSNSNKPIIKDEVIIKSPEQKAKELSTHFNQDGIIITSNYDPDINLYIYNFKATNGEKIMFFYDKKLPYSSNDTINVDVRDNFLIKVTPKTITKPTQELSLSQKKRKLKKRIQNYKIHEAIEEKINTF